MKRPLAISIASASIAIGAIPAIPAVAEVDAKTHKLCLEAKDYLGCVKAMRQTSSNQIDTSHCERYPAGTPGSKYLDCLISMDVQYAPINYPENSYQVGSDDVEVAYGFTYRRSTIKQLKVRGSYGRYITFWGRSANSYKGTSATYLPGNPGSVNCNYNEYGLNSFNATSPLLEYGSGPLLQGNSRKNTFGNVNCHRSGYVAPTYIPGTPGGVQRGWFEYELDCRDGTYNRTGDISQGIYKKGWQDIYYDPTAKAVAERYCSRITSLPLKVGSPIKQTKKKKCTVKELQNRTC